MSPGLSAGWQNDFLPRQIKLFSAFTFHKSTLKSSIKAILTRLLKEQSILTTSISIVDGEYMFVEHELSEEFDIECVDVSDASISDRNKLLEEVEKIMLDYSKSLKNQGKSLCLFLLLKLTNEQYRIVFCTTHLISDIQTQRIIESYFQDRLHVGVPYKNYIKNVLAARNTEKYKLYRDTDHYKNYEEAVKTFYAANPEYAPNEQMWLSEPIVVTISLESATQSIHGYLLYCVSKIINLQFDVVRIPVRITKSNRSFSNNMYFNTIGNFTDSVYSTFDATDGKIENYFDVYQNINTFLIDNEIVMRELNDDFAESLRLYEMSPFALNYLGDFDKAQSYTRNNKAAKYPIIAYSINMKRLIIDFQLGLKEEVFNELESILSVGMAASVEVSKQ
jgi:hypothetical protein